MTGQNTRTAILLILSIALAACSDLPGEITRDGSAFDEIEESASITALGNEPFWNLTIEPAGEGYQARYSTPENIEGTLVTLDRFAGNNGLGFSGKLAGVSLNLALSPGECSDGMSDRLYPYTATLALGEETRFGCAYTSDQPFEGEEQV